MSLNPYEPPAPPETEQQKDPAKYPSVSEGPQWFSSKNDRLVAILAVSFLVLDALWLWS